MPRASSRSSLERRLQLVAGAVEQPLGADGVVAQPGAREPHVQRHRDEPLLGAVVEVALQAAALLQADAEHPLARGAQLLDLRAQLGVQPLVLERERGRRADRVHVRRPARPAPGVVDDRRHALAVALDLGHRPAGAGRGQRRRCGRARRRSAGPRAASRRARATGRRAPARARRAARRAAGVSPSRAISSPTAPLWIMRVRTSVYRNRYGTSANGTIEATQSTSSAVGVDARRPARDTSTISSSSTRDAGRVDRARGSAAAPAWRAASACTSTTSTASHEQRPRRR